jgi:alkanesulfonate monooxygenase SsuD/methylene tetrahydromethanopterin reductase-like flavin-dependent oxidoreductase (luciferase family)
MTFSLMTPLVVGADRGELLERARRVMRLGGEDGDPAAFLEALPEAWLRGTPSEVVAQLEALATAGVERVFLQHLDHADVDAVALVAAEIAPAVA